MSDIPISQTPPEDENSWETLAEDLFGIDLTKKDAAGAASVSDDEFDALTGDDQPATPAEPPSADTDQTTDDVPSPELVEPEFAESPETSSRAASEHTEPTFEAEPIPFADSWSDEATASPDSGEPGPPEDAEAESDDLAPAARDSYWDALDDWDWEEESRSHHRSDSGGRPNGPRRAGGGRRDSGKGRPGRGDRGSGGPRKGSHYSSDADSGKKRTGAGDSPSVSRSARPAETTSKPDFPSRRHEDTDDFDFGIGLVDDEEPMAEDEPEVNRLEETPEEPVGAAEAAEADESDAPRKRRRRRRRRRRPRSDKGGAELSGGAESEALDDEEEEDAIEDSLAEAGFDDEAGLPDEEESIGLAADTSAEWKRAPSTAREAIEGEEAVPREPPATRAEPDDSDEDDLSEDDDLLDDDDDDTADERAASPGDSQEGERKATDKDATVPSAYRNIPTWEEAISYLVKPVVRDDKSRDSNGGGRAYRKPDSSKPPRPPGRRGRRKK